MAFKDLPAEMRPREKLIARGPAALGDAELLALLLRTGVAGKNVLQMSRELLDTFGGIAGLLHTGADDLKKVKGLSLGANTEFKERAYGIPGLEKVYGITGIKFTAIFYLI